MVHGETDTWTNLFSVLPAFVLKEKLLHHSIEVKTARSIAELIGVVETFELTQKGNPVYFRGENQDHKVGALRPSIYRTPQRLCEEYKTYREMQRFNDHEFTADKTAFDKLSRMQHYSMPTRLIDLSEDILSALYFALDGRKNNNQAAVYLIEIDQSQVKYYDSDAVSVVANLVKSPLSDGCTPRKSKQAIHEDANKYRTHREAFNGTESAGYLLHDIKEEKSYFSHKIDPIHLFSILFVKPKLTNNRLHGQKGAYLLFGLNEQDINNSIPIFVEDTPDHLSLNSTIHSEQFPIRKITKVLISCEIRMEHLEKLGITTPYIYPELDHVSHYLSKTLEQ
ncbi:MULTISPECIES: FRG domain-containing protein [unclassified Ectothiorhodospira]|uniref:FRG domain-containing protein n=1 Tax=unclassified Ectothiorhodospira TaxID=2684909 RepID=UPI001EE8CD7E|nr:MULTISPECIES: FRG domain-containing protein [unclassified Ectothiorhodospira]MCG5516376.1 FRG domain-containing protein [Ectothiorhodospira sp. 9100]MCG5519374.1 FRG domain-containing protein [Ectothiorhodospira sp. 9905]